MSELLRAANVSLDQAALPGRYLCISLLLGRGVIVEAFFYIFPMFRFPMMARMRSWEIYISVHPKIWRF